MRPIPAIRYLKEEDVPYVIKLAEKAMKEVFPDENFREDKVNSIVRNTLKDSDQTMLVLTIDNIVRGYILAAMSEYYFSSTKICYCIAVYVEKEYRAYGLEMLKSLVSWAKYKGAKTCTVSSFKGLSPEGIGKVYNKLGFFEKENAYWKELN